jgi:hypothetical protein
MKALKFMILIFAIFTINGCTDEDKIEQPPVTKSENGGIYFDGGFYPFYHHSVYLAVIDASGNDLTKGIGIEVAMYDPNSDYIDGRYWITSNEKEYTEGRIKPELYTLDIIFEDGIPNPLKPEPAPIVNGYPLYVLDNPNPRPSIGLQKGSFIEKTHPNDFLPPGINTDYNYLYFDFSSYKIYGLPSALLYDIPSKEVPFAEKVIFRLTCPYLFGDNEAHDIVTLWEPYLYENGEVGIYAVCHSMEFEGKELTVDGQRNEPLTIILDR